MKEITARIKELKRKGATNYWGERITSQLEYAIRVSGSENGVFDALIEKVLDFIEKRLDIDGSITTQTAKTAEAMLGEMTEAAKSYEVICAAHAHIDMNWMWRWDETVSVTLDTFRTMLDLMDEFPDFKFSQSQASVYRIVEEYDPEMLQEIKKRVAEGRWEVTASTWVEADKNMPAGESHARHLLYTKQYLSKLLDIDPASLDIDFEPDTFGHSINVPEILQKGGVRYYYHCRGYDANTLYRWKAPSGSSILVYREPFWYNSDIKPEQFQYVPEICSTYGMKTMLKVYGVGDHGGGPTRRDIERIIDMDAGPVFPRFRFGTFRDFFRRAEKIADRLPVVEGELNFIFTGCYTTQTRIKAANRTCEAAMNEAELFGVVSALCTGFNYSRESFFKGWENVLFNHFHDIIPGSGIIDTREYTMGLFQKTMAIAGSVKKRALGKIAANIDTTGLVPEADYNVKGTVSEGAGVGYGMTGANISQVERGRGKTRIFHLFNPAPFERNEVVEIISWDWTWDVNRIIFRDSEGKILEHQLLNHGRDNYWGHHYVKSLVSVSVPACGYTTITMTENSCIEEKLPALRDPRVEKPAEYVLENEYIKVVFDPLDASIILLTDKKSGEKLIDGGIKSGIFRFIEEDTAKGMTAWYVGRHMNVTELKQNVKIKDYVRSNLRQSLTYEIEFHNSSLRVTVSLDYNKPSLRYDTTVDWREVGSRDTCIPQLSFYLPVSYKCASYKYDVPFGVIERTEMDMDVPGCSFILGRSADPEKSGLMIVTSGKYGFRGYKDSMSVTLIRSSYDPDPYPEFGRHNISFDVVVVEDCANKKLLETAYCLNHPVTVVSGKRHSGGLPHKMSFMSLEKGNAVLSAVKMPESSTNENELVIRLYETEGSKSQTVIRFESPIKSVAFLDINENMLENGEAEIDGCRVLATLEPYSITTLKIVLEGRKFE